MLRNVVAYLEIKRSGKFDPEYYKDQQANNNHGGGNQVWHYVTVGWKNGFNPNETFDTEWYLSSHPDVKQASGRLNPFVHYLKHGLGETRQTSQSGVLYTDWISHCENYDEALIRQKLSTYELRPLISILVPVYKPELAHLEQCIDSVLAQVYQNWELCISDDASNDDTLHDYLKDISARDARIKLLFRKTNGNISANSNSALELATGQYIALLDQDDLLANHALYEVITRINKNPEPQIIYSDEDKLDSNGVRTSPHFKPDWNRDLLYANNYISHLGVYNRDLVIAAGGFRAGYEGSQDFDLILRCSAMVAADQIEHIPKILYHWRVSEGSTAQSAENKPYTWDAGLKALRNFMETQHPGVEVFKGVCPNTFRVTWPVRGERPLVTLIVPTRNGGKVLKKCITSILKKTDYPNFEVLIIDNQSDSGETLAFLEGAQKDRRVKVMVFDEPFNFSKIVNRGVDSASGEYIGLVNDDIEVISGNWLTDMLGLASREDVGCVGAKLYYPDGTIQHAGVVLGINGVASHGHKHFPREASGYFGRLVLAQECAAVTAACLLVDKEIYRMVGGFDDENLAIAFNDIDFCLKVRAQGYSNVWTPWAEMYHYESLSRGYEDTDEKRARFESEVEFMKRKWKSTLTTDPAYSPNLTLDREDFSIAIPPGE